MPVSLPIRSGFVIQLGGRGREMTHWVVTEASIHGPVARPPIQGRETDEDEAAELRLTLTQVRGTLIIESAGRER